MNRSLVLFLVPLFLLLAPAARAQPYVVVEVSGTFDRSDVDGQSLPADLGIGVPYTAVFQYEPALAGPDQWDTVADRLLSDVDPATSRWVVTAGGSTWLLPGSDPDPNVHWVKHGLAPLTLDRYQAAMNCDAAPAEFPGTVGGLDRVILDVYETSGSPALWIDRILPGVEHISDADQIDPGAPGLERYFTLISSSGSEGYWQVEDIDATVTIRVESAPVRSRSRSWSALKSGFGER